MSLTWLRSRAAQYPVWCEGTVSVSACSCRNGVDCAFPFFTVGWQLRQVQAKVKSDSEKCIHCNVTANIFKLWLVTRKSHGTRAGFALFTEQHLLAAGSTNSTAIHAGLLGLVHMGWPPTYTRACSSSGMYPFQSHDALWQKLNGMAHWPHGTTAKRNLFSPQPPCNRVQST